MGLGNRFARSSAWDHCPAAGGNPRAADHHCPVAAPDRSPGRKGQARWSSRYARYQAPRRPEATPEGRPKEAQTHGFARKSMTPTPPGGACGGVLPECGAGLAGDWVQRTREVIEVPMAPVEVTEHVFIARTCPICQQRRTPSATLDGVWSWAASGWASTCSA